jgi:hypothetical protein
MQDYTDRMGEVYEFNKHIGALTSGTRTSTDLGAKPATITLVWKAGRHLNEGVRRG